MKKIILWVDADACPKPVKEHIFKSAYKMNINATFVANSYMNIPHSPCLSFVKVEQGADVADFYIVEHVKENDLVITADIPLADLVVKKGAIALNPRGELYTEENIRERLSIRDFMQELRDGGVDTGGPSAFDARDKESFTNSFHKIITKLQRI